MREVKKAGAERAPILERMIESVAPRIALKRREARMRLDMLAMVGGYTGARRDRRQTASWGVSAGSATSDTIPDLPALRERSRDLARNAPIATGFINNSVNQIVGTGMSATPSIDHVTLGIDEDRAAEINAAIKRRFDAFAASRFCDITETQNFYHLQGLVFRSYLESGDVFAMLPMKAVPGWEWETRIQVIEADRVANPTGQRDDERFAGGIEMDEAGAPVRAHVLRRHPGAATGTKTPAGMLASDPVEIRDPQTGRMRILHVFERLRPDQPRGIPVLASIIEPLKMLDKFTEAELMGAVVSALFTVFVKKTGGGGPPLNPMQGNIPGGGSEDRSTGSDYKMGPGAILDLAPGESIESPASGRPNPEFAPFFEAIVQQIAIALDMPYEVLVKRYLSSYTASRAAMLDARRAFERRREILSFYFCQPVYETWLIEEVAKGAIDAPGFLDVPLIRAAWSRCIWTGDAFGLLDEGREIEAANLRVESGYSTREDETLAITGKNFYDNVPRLKKEAEAMRAAGITPPSKSGQAAQQGRVDPQPEPPAQPQPTRNGRNR